MCRFKKRTKVSLVASNYSYPFPAHGNPFVVTLRYFPPAGRVCHRSASVAGGVAAPKCG